VDRAQRLIGFVIGHAAGKGFRTDPVVVESSYAFFPA
jgi:hypothetical protein